MAKIDLDRGVEMRVCRHAVTDPKGNVGYVADMEVYMYIEQPGVYLNAHGVEVTQAAAELAGFPVKFYEAKRLKMVRQSAALAEIEAEFRGDGTQREEVVNEFNGWKVVDIGAGYNVFDPEGNKMNLQPLPSEVGMNLFNKLSGVKAKGKSDKPSAPAE